jgi:hypothetical protein
MIGSISAFYPGEDGTKSYITVVEDAGLDFIFGEIGTDDPAWTFWVGLMMNTYLYLIIAIVAILIGSKIIPSKEQDGLELLLGSNPRSARNYYLENMFSNSLLLFVSLVPSFILLVLSSLFHDAADIISRIAIAYIFIYVVSLVCLVGTSVISILKFSSSAGKKAGFGYLVFAFLVEMSSTSEETEQYAKLSINSYANPTSGLLSGDFNWIPILVLLVVIIGFLVIATWKVKYPDYIEFSKTKKKNKKRRISIFPTLSPSSKYAKRFPLLFEQLRRDFSYFLGWTGFVLFFTLYVMLIMPSEESLEEMFTQFDMPLIKAMLYNHTPTNDYTGWMLYEFHSINWIYFGLFVLFIAASIPNREVRTNSQDIVWGNNIHPQKIILSRTIMMILEYSVMLWIVFLSKFALDSAMGFDNKAVREFQVFTIYWIHYISLGLFIISVSMLPQISKGRTYSLIIYFYFIFINLTAYASGAEWLKYLGLFGYIDPAGMMLGLTSFSTELLKSVFILGITLSLFFLSLKYRYHNADLI